jgi:hypothetical protein
MRDSYSLRRDNYVIYSGDVGEINFNYSSINSWRPRKNNQVKKIAFIRAVARKIIFIP